MFIQGTSWKTSQLGLVILALEGVIPIQDKRLPDMSHDPDLEDSGEITMNKSDTKQKEHATEEK